MKLLALDTATERIALALAVGEASHTVDADGGAAASAALIPQALSLLAAQGLRVADLDAIAFGRGPGAFTGLRTAVSVAQGLAFGAGKPVLAIDSLLIVADDARVQWATARPAESTTAATSPAAFLAASPDASPAASPLWWVAMDARMDEVYAAAYRHEVGGWKVVCEPALYDLPSLLARWQALPPDHVAGSALAAFGDRLPVSQQARRWPVQQDRAAALLRLSREAWEAGLLLPAEQALPLYLRDKVALTTAERAAARALAEAGAGPSGGQVAAQRADVSFARGQKALGL